MMNRLILAAILLLSACTDPIVITPPPGPTPSPTVEPAPVPTETAVPDPDPQPSATPTDTPTPAPSPSPTDVPALPVGAITPEQRAALTVQDYDYGGGNHIPGSAAPDILGAFRIICRPGPINWDDAIVYPGLIGGSPHLHQNAGNTGINGKSTHETLLVSGDGTCNNMLNRSAYWVPALMNATGQIISFDYMGLYYKRLPVTDPSCLTVSIKGCVGIPDGLRYLSGYDMKRMGEAQPENMTYSFRCAEDGKPQVHRALINQAVADCGGSGRIWAQVDFGNCWDGRLDSPDHRKHVAFGGYGDWGYYRCPNTHQYIIPQLAQIVSYTIEPGDGEIYFASDRMGGMNMPGGSTFHADYIEAWDKITKQTWEDNCINKMLSCSDGSLGNGTMMLRSPLTYKAEQRLLTAPPRPSPGGD